MALFAISDLHLGFSVNKSMDRFGPHWVNHPQRIAQAWRQSVTDQDTVLICGDTSWAMRLDEAQADLDYVVDLPGRKILLRGNHDYWWATVKKVRRLLPPTVELLQNNSFLVEGWAVCGSRGWMIPGPEVGEDDEKIFQRELGRLRLSLESAPKDHSILAMLHYPPFEVEDGQSEVMDLLHEFAVKHCVYGHLHAMDPGTYPQGVHAGIRFDCVSVDMIGFQPLLLELPLPDAR